MPRPTVLIATTDPAMAYALRKRLDEPCRTLGLRLDICPGGEAADPNSTDEVSRIPVYRSAEALFEYLESRKPMELADTLVVLDVGAGLEEAFSPAAQASEQGWHATKDRAGVAVELILRFPQLFPVILSPVVPTELLATEPPSETAVCDPLPLSEYRQADSEWDGFGRLCELLCGRDEIPYAPKVLALNIPLHFVSPLDGGRGLRSTLARFARGMRCWFDPTGLRTLVKNRFLGTLFGSASDWSKTAGQREVLLNRLGHVAVAIDEEREFAVLNAYAAWKFGRRAWIVTTYAEFDQSPLWTMDSLRSDIDVVVLRDIDLRFPDIPTDGRNIREQLKYIELPAWKPKIANAEGVRIRAISSVADICWGSARWFRRPWSPEEQRLGQRPIARCGKKNDRFVQYRGLRKPISTLYKLQQLLGDKGKVATNSSAALIGAVEEKGATVGHGAPYLNLAMAESLLRQSRRQADGPIAHTIAALLASEAYELLLGMSKTTALEALIQMHKQEVVAEVEFPGVAHNIHIKERRKDIMATLNRLYSRDRNQSDYAKVENKKRLLYRRFRDFLHARNVIQIFLSQFWAELRIAYKNGEQFEAAEQANAESLVQSKWIPYDPVKWPMVFILALIAALFGHVFWVGKVDIDFPYVVSKDAAIMWVPIFVVLVSIFVLFSQNLKRIALRCATALWAWLIAAFILSGLTSAAYHHLAILKYGAGSRDVPSYLRLFQESVLSSLGVTLTDFLRINIVEHSGDPGRVVAIVHLGLSYLLFGLLVTMLYRKVTRD